MNKSQTTEAAGSADDAGKAETESALGKKRDRASVSGRVANAVDRGAQAAPLEALVDTARALGDRVEALIRQRPLVAVAGAAALGAVLGGVAFTKAGRLVFIAAAGALATEVWKSEGKIDVRGILDELTREDGEADSARAPHDGIAAESG